MKDEMFFLRSFLDYYRSLGVDEFLILEDGSHDGTLEFLLEQPDVTVLKSSFSYGEEFRRRSRLPWRLSRMRAGIRLKTLIPDAYLRRRWCLCADADEYLILPPQFTQLSELTQELEALDIPVLIGSLIETYPRTFADLATPVPAPRDFSELISLSPYFDDVKLLEVKDSGDIFRLNPSASGRLFSAYNIPFGSKQEVATVEEVVASGRRKNLAIGSAIHKMPLIRPSRKIRYTSSHFASSKPTPAAGVALLHFKFTVDLLRRLDLAIRSKAWSGGSKKYSKYEWLLSRMKSADGTFLGPNSAIYQSARQLVNSGNLWWDLDKSL
ncbi:glycosyltransferase family 2 protein [Wenzhouxiangella sp. EGI_FJ10305]|uniref:glycosyltransferase family 2 protein n=1 Tax=Wenzhouxiangella sp. EGI_FJ10305 TaxID=3243768 RepID=UPI0035D8F5EA